MKSNIFVEEAGQMVDYILILPKNYESARKYPLFIYMHGRGYSSNDVLNDWYSLFTNQSCYILIPEASIKLHDRSFSWYDRDSEKFIVHMEESESMIVALTQHMIKKYNVDTSRIVLSGFSQGGRLAYYIGFKNPKLFSEIVPISGYYMADILDPYIKNIGNLKVSIYIGTQDDVNPFEAVEKVYNKFKAEGINTSLHGYPVEHTCTDEMLETILNNI
ncbi:MAG: dienelactone hydrolase family protein [Candidatus Omnitrophica bacterium]|nr:dienelactone hydrolase family protein [Candidatus Omnitrophota bacterium]